MRRRTLLAAGAARLGKNLAVSNGSGRASKGSSVASVGNNWDSGISIPSFVSTDASTTYNSLDVLLGL